MWRMILNLEIECIWTKIRFGAIFSSPRPSKIQLSFLEMHVCISFLILLTRKIFEWKFLLEGFFKFLVITKIAFVVVTFASHTSKIYSSKCLKLRVILVDYKKYCPLNIAWVVRLPAWQAKSNAGFLKSWLRFKILKMFLLPIRSTRFHW